MVEKITPLLILVVEDDLLVRCCIAGWPRQGSHIVIEAATGEEALTLLRAQDDEPISALFTEIQLGGRLKSSLSAAAKSSSGQLRAAASPRSARSKRGHSITSCLKKNRSISRDASGPCGSV